MKPKSGEKLVVKIKDSDLKTSYKALEIYLSSLCVLSLKYQNFHWNVKGVNFAQFHVLFEQHYDKLQEMIDDVAERIRSLGFVTPASMNFFLKNSLVQEGGLPKKDLAMVKELKNDQSLIVDFLRTKIDHFKTSTDKGTEGFLVDYIQFHEKQLWFLDSHLV